MKGLYWVGLLCAAVIKCVIHFIPVDRVVHHEELYVLYHREAQYREDVSPTLFPYALALVCAEVELEELGQAELCKGANAQGVETLHPELRKLLERLLLVGHHVYDLLDGLEVWVGNWCLEDVHDHVRVEDLLYVLLVAQRRYAHDHVRHEPRPLADCVREPDVVEPRVKAVHVVHGLDPLVRLSRHEDLGLPLCIIGEVTARRYGGDEIFVLVRAETVVRVLACELQSPVSHVAFEDLHQQPLHGDEARQAHDVHEEHGLRAVHDVDLMERYVGLSAPWYRSFP
eukprot:768712-Hanusia_phi.AAC.5